jgi:DNA invertase Pin-like site-specific DNA recombinase
MNKNKRAYSYVRFSTPEQMQGDSFRRQTELANRYAKKKGLILDDTISFQDLGVSAYKGKNASVGALRRFLDLVEVGEIEEGSFLLVESLDRITRSQIVRAQGLFMEIIASGVNLVTLADEKEYSEEGINANPMDFMYSLLIMMRAHEESAIRATIQSNSTMIGLSLFVVSSKCIWMGLGRV